jgi:hypothetical protein
MRRPGQFYREYPARPGGQAPGGYGRATWAGRATSPVAAHSQPSTAMLAAYQADPALASTRIDFTATVREVLEVLVAGLLARH